MRTLFLTLPLILLAALGGVVADRWVPTRSLIDTAYERLSPTPLPPDPGFPFQTPLEHWGNGPLTSETLLAFGVRNCLALEPVDASVRQGWFENYQGRTGSATANRPATFPALEQHPGIVKLELIHSPAGSDRSHCGATRVSEHWFMTAAHCFEDEDEGKRVPVYSAMVLTPSLDVHSAESALVPIDRALCHGAHGTSRYRYPNDVALFYVEDIAAFSAVPVARIEDEGLQLSMPDFENAYLAAWGRNGKSRYFQGGPVRLEEIGEAVLVSKRIGDQGPDVGDSGSPLYVDFGKGPVVVGLLSQVTRAEARQDDAAVYVRAKAVRAWIDRTMAICEQSGQYVC
jgi:hypothetical protein